MKREITTNGHPVFEDSWGARGAIFPARDKPGTAAIDTDPGGGGDILYVHAHELAEVVAAIYESAGQPVPVLPVIHDEAQVVSLASLIGSALSGACRDAGHLPVSAYADAARALLAHGVRLPEAR